MARKKKHPEHVNHERWLVSYADFITLLFAFFTSMYAISTVDAKKAGQMVFSTRAAFNLDFFPTDKPVLGSSGNSPAPHIETSQLAPEQLVPDMPRSRRPPRRPLGEGRHGIQIVARNLRRYIDQAKLGDQVRLRIQRQNIIISLSEAAFFESGTAEVRAGSLKTFDAVAAMIAQSDATIRVEGHSDDRPVNSTFYRSNWQLSAERAVTVVTYLIEEFAFPPQNLSAAGFAQYRPVASNETEAGRAQNRRVDIIILGEGDSQRPTVAETPAPADAPPGAEGASPSGLGSAKP